MLCVIALSTVSTTASASLLADRLEVSMYGRIGAAWDPTTGRYVQGARMNPTGSAIGGRLEEGDYFEPSLKLHLLERNTDPNAQYLDFVLTPAMYMKGGLLQGVISDRFTDSLDIELFQGYMEAGNIGIQGLRVWGGARFYRGTDVHIADTFYFNNLAGQGGGLAYGPLDLAIILNTTTNTSQYNYDVDGNGTLDLRRQRTVFIAQYAHKFEAGHSLHGLAELHVLPTTKVTLADGSRVGLNDDIGWVVGVKGHLDLGNGSFNDVSLRYGSRAASGSRGGAQTFDSFGAPGAQGRYDEAAGVQFVEHFLYNFSPLFSLNAYGMVHYNSGLGNLDPVTKTQADISSLDFGVGARGALYLHEHFHLLGEVHYAGLKPNSDADLATVTKFSIIPTFVPLAGNSLWNRPHFRLFYTLALFNEANVAGRYSPYQQLFLPSEDKKVGHYVGARVEWWF
jgi:maltoporin